MAEILKPTNLSLTWASGGDILDPGASKYATGWQVEIPPRQWFNYLDNRQDEAIAHINQHGVAVWDSTTEYQEDKSYTQGPTNGTIYRCVQTHTNQNPETDVGNVYWIIAFASAGDFYTKTETDGKYLSKTANLGDLTNTSVARFWLDVYSKAETYTQAQVDAKTTVASAGQTQAQSSNTVLLTPLGLSTALQGANQSLAANGYQKLPGGLILQWGSISRPTTTPEDVQVAITFPIAFPTACRTLSGAVVSSGVSDPNQAVSARLITNSGFTLIFDAMSTTYDGNATARWFALGH